MKLPAVVSMPVAGLVAILSFKRTGLPCSGPRTLPAFLSVQEIGSLQKEMLGCSVNDGLEIIIVASDLRETREEGIDANSYFPM